MMRSLSVVALLVSVVGAEIAPSLRQPSQKPPPYAFAPRKPLSQPLKAVPFSKVGANPLVSRNLRPTSRISAEFENENSGDLRGILKNFNPFGQNEDGKYNDVFKTEDAEFVTLYKLESDGRCRESTLPKGIKANIAKVTEGLLLGFQEGNCASQGYKSVSGENSVSFPFLGEVVITSFQRSEVYSDISVPVVFSVAFLAGSVLILAMVRFRRSVSTPREDPLLATYS